MSDARHRFTFPGASWTLADQPHCCISWWGSTTDDGITLKESWFINDVLESPTMPVCTVMVWLYHPIPILCCCFFFQAETTLVFPQGRPDLRMQWPGCTKRLSASFFPHIGCNLHVSLFRSRHHRRRVGCHGDSWKAHFFNHKTRSTYFPSSERLKHCIAIYLQFQVYIFHACSTHILQVCGKVRESIVELISKGNSVKLISWRHLHIGARQCRHRHQYVAATVIVRSHW